MHATRFAFRLVADHESCNEGNSPAGIPVHGTLVVATLDDGRFRSELCLWLAQTATRISFRNRFTSWSRLDVHLDSPDDGRPGFAVGEGNAVSHHAIRCRRNLSPTTTKPLHFNHWSWGRRVRPSAHSYRATVGDAALIVASFGEPRCHMSRGRPLARICV